MIRDLVESVSGYPGLFVLCAVSGLLIPLPEDFSLMYAGVRIAAGDWSWPMTLVVATAGVLVRDLVAWGFGRLFGRWLLRASWIRRLVGERKLARAEAMVSSHGASAVLVGRFLVGFRSPVFMVAGAMGVSMRSFTFWDLLGLLFAVPITVGLGYAFGEPIADLAFWALQRARVVVVCGGALGLLWLWWRLRTTGEGSADPDVSSREERAGS